MVCIKLTYTSAPVAYGVRFYSFFINPSLLYIQHSWFSLKTQSDIVKMNILFHLSLHVFTRPINASPRFLFFGTHSNPFRFFSLYCDFFSFYLVQSERVLHETHSGNSLLMKIDQLPSQNFHIQSPSPLTIVLATAPSPPKHRHTFQGMATRHWYLEHYLWWLRGILFRSVTLETLSLQSSLPEQLVILISVQSLPYHLSYPVLRTTQS